jgi:hypothetical protein
MARTALTIGKIKHNTPIPIKPMIPNPKSKISGMQIRAYKNMLS